MSLLRKVAVLAEHSAFCVHDVVRLAGHASRGALAGMNFAVNDVFAIEGVRSCFGNPIWLQTHEPALQTAPAVENLLAAGATLVGLTLTDELALSLTGKNAHYGMPTNPARVDRIPGGSSAGSAVAVASGQVDFALGTDTGGSVRVPAGHCGVFGMRPTHGAISIQGVLPLAPRFDTVGWFARNPRMLRDVGRALLPADAHIIRPTRLLLPLDANDVVHGRAWRVFTQAADEVIVTTGLSQVPTMICTAETGPLEAWLDTYLSLQNEQLRQVHGAWIDEHNPKFGSLIASRITRAMNAQPVTDTVYRHAELIAHHMADILGDSHILALPTAAGAPPSRRESDQNLEVFTGKCLALCAVASLAGMPQITLPLGILDGCPFGVSLIGPVGSDRQLLDLVQRFSTVRAV